MKRRSMNMRTIETLEDNKEKYIDDPDMTEGRSGNEGDDFVPSDPFGKNNNRGVASIEVILILVVLIALVVIFRDQITSLANTIWKSINGDAQDLM